MTPEASREVGRSLKAMSALLADAGDASGARRMEQQAERYLSGKAEQPRTARLVRFETKSGTIALNPELVQQVSRHPGNADLCEITMLSHKVVVKGELEAVLQALQQDVGN